MNQGKAFKLLIKHRLGLYSWSSPLAGRILYVPHQWVERPPDCGPLATFAAMEAVVKFPPIQEAVSNCRTPFASWFGRYSVWECTVRMSSDDHLWASIDGRRHSVFSNLPEGTLLADAVRLDREVSWEEFYHHITAHKEMQNVNE